MTAVLSVSNLSVQFRTPRGPVHAVDNVSFDLQAGETLALVGESGCGKSVTALSLLRLLPSNVTTTSPESRITFGEHRIHDATDDQLRQIRGKQLAMIFQEPGACLNPVLRIGTQVAEAVLAHEPVSKAEAKQRTLELLHLVGLPDPVVHARQYAHQLSGGMQQRVMIAIALSCRPQVLIADEPTTALDVTVQAQIIGLLNQLKRDYNMSVLFISHNLGVVAGFADRVAVMYGGRIVELAPTADIFERPAHPYTRGLLNAIPRLDRPVDHLAGIPGHVPDASDWPNGCRFHPRCSERFEPCATEVPELTTIRPQCSAACWLHRSEKTE